MLTASLFLFAAAIPQGPGSVVINEFSYDDTSSNNRVFVELYNTTSAPIDISGWVLDGQDGTASNPENADATIPAGTTLAPGDFYVVGQAESVPPVPLVGVPNVDHNVSTMNTVLETGADGLVLRDAALNPIDSVTWEQARWSNPLPAWVEGDGLQGDIYNADWDPQSACRVIDGYDTDSNGNDFRIGRWSPGTSNQAAWTSSPIYGNDFDDAIGSTVDADFSYSFVPGTTEDPATLGITASPQGGNCSIWYDASGGGDANFFNAPSHQDWVVEAYVYLRGPEAAFDVDDMETWGIGVRGSTDSFGEPPNINSLYTYAGNSNYQPGITGIAWFQIITAVSSDLYLVDFNDGGSTTAAGFTILHGPIAIQAGVNDGWQRVRLATLGSDVVGNIGGTFGCDDGTRYTASGVTTAVNGVYIQYREWVSTAGAHRPLVLDSLQIAPNTAASTTLIGTGSPTSVGTPTIAAGGLPTLGNLTFSVDGSDLVPSGASFTALQIGAPALPGQQIPGAPAGAVIYLSPATVTALLNINSASGTSSVTVPIPCQTTFTGLPIGAQLLDLDLSLSASVPVGTSSSLSITIGN